MDFTKYTIDQLRQMASENIRRLEDPGNPGNVYMARDCLDELTRREDRKARLSLGERIADAVVGAFDFTSEDLAEGWQSHVDSAVRGVLDVLDGHAELPKPVLDAPTLDELGPGAVLGALWGLKLAHASVSQLEGSGAATAEIAQLVERMVAYTANRPKRFGNR